MMLGLTGGYCAGKNAVASVLEAMGWTCIDVDKLGHEAIELARDAIIGRFGSTVLGSNGMVDRQTLARIVFSDPKALADQEAIVHPVAIRLLEERIAAATSAARIGGRTPRICINAALLHRTERLASCDAIIEVRAPLLVRVARGMTRDKTGALAALRRIARQRKFRAALLAAASAAKRPIVALDNAGGRDSLEKSVARALAGLPRLVAPAVPDYNRLPDE
jgi:dephospho-CoA kinase